MLKLGAWCGGATAVLFVYAGVIRSLIESLSNQLTGIELSIGIVFECVLFVGLCLFAACAPAGVMAMARAIKNSRWFIWGGTAVMVTLLILGVVVPFLIGPFCLVRQIGKVKGLHESIQKLEALLSNNGLND